MQDTAAARTACPEPERLEAYARHELPASEAAHVEEHFLACDACWGRVRRVLELRAAFESEEAAPEVRRGPGAVARSRRWRPALAAAALVAVALGGAWLWQVGSGERGAPPLRGGGERGALLEVSLEVSAEGLEIDWRRVPGARVYRVELGDDEGALVLARETEAPGIDLAADELVSAGPAPERARVLALDELRQELAASPWREIGTGGPDRRGRD